jgi:hypothetical protein
MGLHRHAAGSTAPPPGSAVVNDATTVLRAEAPRSFTPQWPLAAAARVERQPGQTTLAAAVERWQA